MFILISALFLIILIFYLYKDYFINKLQSYVNIIKIFYNPTEIPLYFFQVWINAENTIPDKIRQNFENIKKQNPEFECKLYNNSDCIQFLKDNYDKDVQDAYNKIIPGAFKADLIRYCILYKKGGIYLDAKMKPINGFLLKDVSNKEYFTRDFKSTGGGVCNGFLVCKPGNKKLHDAIQEIVKNVNTQFYGESSLEPTGPLLLKKFFTGKEIEEFDFEFTIDPDSPDKSNHILIISREPENRKMAILEKDVELVKVQSNNRKEKNYDDLWEEQNIYKYERFTNML